jgi:predicted RNase H-like nuclease (RuvC/YqgF family)
MHRLFLKIAPFVLLISWAAYGQSLGEIARQNREKHKAKDASSTAKPEVITNENLPKSPDAELKPPTSGEKTTLPPHVSSGGQSAEQWKNQILAQKKVIAILQAQIDKLSDSIHFVVAAEYYNGVQHNQRQVKKQEMVAQMQHQLEEQKKRLDEMQEAARQAGFGNAVYDP